MLKECPDFIELTPQLEKFLKDKNLQDKPGIFKAYRKSLESTRKQAESAIENYNIFLEELVEDQEEIQNEYREYQRTLPTHEIDWSFFFNKSIDSPDHNEFQAEVSNDLGLEISQTMFGKSWINVRLFGEAGFNNVERVHKSLNLLKDNLPVVDLKNEDERKLRRTYGEGFYERIIRLGKHVTFDILYNKGNFSNSSPQELQVCWSIVNDKCLFTNSVNIFKEFNSMEELLNMAFDHYFFQRIDKIPR